MTVQRPAMCGPPSFRALTADERLPIRRPTAADRRDDAGQQRIWIDDGGATAKMDIVHPGESATVLDSSATVPAAEHVVMHVQSLKKNATAVFDLFVARFSGSRCYWHGTEWSETG